jgi:hypothetical protein
MTNRNALSLRADAIRAQLPGAAPINHPRVAFPGVDSSRSAELARGRIASALDGGGESLILEIEGRTALLSTQVFLRTARPRAFRLCNINASAVAVTVAG